jgi:hypothetical protein
MLEREEYVEQAYFFRTMRARMKENLPMQDAMAAVREEILTTTKLPLAIDYMVGELRHQGVFGTAMAKLDHYFTPFQSYLIGEAENEEGRFDLIVALEILEREAEFRARGDSPQCVFLYEFEALCRNRLSYDRGLRAVAGDAIFDDDWRAWIEIVARQVGIIDFADLIYVRSEHYRQEQSRLGRDEPAQPVLFGDKEGRIARANRHRDPLLLFSALHRQLDYPQVPRPVPPDETLLVVPQLLRRVDHLERRLKLMEEEQRGGIDLARFYNSEENKPGES